MSRLVALAALMLGGLALAACSYSPRPASGAQLCGPAGGKLCPDGYQCLTGNNGKDYCFLEGDGGAGGALSGAAGKGGAGGHAGAGATGQAGAGVAGAPGIGGAGGKQVCEPVFASTWSGRFSTIDSGGVMGPTMNVAPGGGSFTLLANRTTTTTAGANIGVAWTFDPCADASAFTGISFSISGTVSNCQVIFQVDDTERSGGGNGGPAVTINAVSGTPQTVQLAWSTSGGQPAGQTDASHVSILIWGFSIQPATSCMAQVTITDLTFY